MEHKFRRESLDFTQDFLSGVERKSASVSILYPYVESETDHEMTRSENNRDEWE
jgi:hypothetical protein